MSVVALDRRVPFAPPQLDTGEIAEVVSTLESGWLSTGPKVDLFESAFADYIGARHAVALNSCTAGLHLSLLAAGVGPGDEVITTPLTFCATANAIVHCGAIPVFADVEPGTGNLDPAAIAHAVTERTRAVVPVHYAGRPVDVVALAALARRHGLVVVEDAAHCVEGVAAGRKVGTTAEFTCFSFYATKNLTTGEGGMVTTDSTEAASRIRIASRHGMSRQAWSRRDELGPASYDLLLPGFKYNMMDLQAAIGLHQLAAIGDHYVRRAAIWQRYDEAFADLPLEPYDPLPDGTVHARHLYTIRIADRSGHSRDEVAEHLAAHGIASSIHFPAVHLHRYYSDRFHHVPGQFPIAEGFSNTVLSLPFSPALRDEQVEQVIAAVRSVWGA